MYKKKKKKTKKQKPTNKKDFIVWNLRIRLLNQIVFVGMMMVLRHLLIRRWLAHRRVQVGSRCGYIVSSKIYQSYVMDTGAFLCLLLGLLPQDILLCMACDLHWGLCHHNLSRYVLPISFPIFI